MPKHFVSSALLAVLAATAACSRPVEGEAPAAAYDPQSGRLRQLTYDSNRNGKNDAVGHMDGTRIRHIELDLDENGKTDRWDIYGEDRRLEKVGFSRLNDGVMDAQAFYDPPGVLSRLEISTTRDGRFNRVEFYRSGLLVRSHEDTNLDGRPDKWETYRPYPEARPGEPPYAITSVAFDDRGVGIPQRRLAFAKDGTVVRVELDPEGDGTFTAAGQADAQKHDHR